MAFGTHKGHIGGVALLPSVPSIAFMDLLNGH